MLSAPSLRQVSSQPTCLDTDVTVLLNASAVKLSFKGMTLTAVSQKNYVGA